MLVNQLPRISPAILAASLTVFTLCMQPALAADQSAVGAAPASQPPTDANPSSSQAVAWINGEPIAYAALEPSVTAFIRGKNLGPESLARVNALALQKFIEERLLANFLKVQNLSVSREEIDSAISHMRANLAKQNQNYDELVAQGRILEPGLRAVLHIQIQWDKYVQSSATEEALQVFFNQVREKFDGTQRRVSHILLRPGGLPSEESVKLLIEKAKELKRKITDGDMTFDAAVSQYSAGPSRRKGGDLGYCGLDGPMSRAFTDVVFSLPRDEIGDPLPSPFGVHLIKVTEIKPGNKTWRNVMDKLFPAYSSYLQNKIVSEQLATARIEFAPNFPHFKPGTNELVMPEPVGSKQ